MWSFIFVFRYRSQVGIWPFSEKIRYTSLRICIEKLFKSTSVSRISSCWYNLFGADTILTRNTDFFFQCPEWWMTFVVKAACTCIHIFKQYLLWNINGWEEIKFAQIFIIFRPRWPTCPYISFKSRWKHSSQRAMKQNLYLPKSWKTKIIWVCIFSSYDHSVLRGVMQDNHGPLLYLLLYRICYFLLLHVMGKHCLCFVERCSILFKLYTIWLKKCLEMIYNIHHACSLILDRNV